MKKTRLALIVGGKSGEHEVSLVSGLFVYEALDKEKFDVTVIGVTKEGKWIRPDIKQWLSGPRIPKNISLRELESFSPWDLLNTKNFDVAFPVLHGPLGEDGTMQGFFEILEIPYVGSGVLASALAMDKDAAKRIFKEAGLPVVPSKTLLRADYRGLKLEAQDPFGMEFGYPYFVKPANMGSSVGVSKIKSARDAAPAFEKAFQYDTKVLIEKGIEARELECSVLGNDSPRASVVGEIRPRHEFYSFEAKYIDDKGADLLIPAENLGAEKMKEIGSMALRAFKALGCAGMARVDFFMDKKNGDIYLNEVNTIPGFTPISMYPKMWAHSGLAYPALLEELVQLALQKHTEKKSLKTSFDP